jgi:predicted nucleic acid-binding protein
MTAFAVIYDACVLHPPSLRDFLIRLALTGKVRARWTDEILDETFRSILARRTDLSMANLERTRELMNASVPDCRVTGHMPLIGGLTLPDPDDRHVLAAAIVAGAQVIVTFNLKDFPRDLLAPFNVEARHPDEFVVNQIDLAPAAVIKVVIEQAQSLKNPPRTISDLLDEFQAQGLVQSVAKLRDMFRG